MEYASNNIIPYFYRYLKADKPGKLRYDAMTQMLTGINNFTKNMAIEGPFFSGKKFGAVDIAFAPFAYRINLLLGYYRNFNLSDNSDDWFRYKQWYEAVIAQPSFIKSIFEQKDWGNEGVLILPILGIYFLCGDSCRWHCSGIGGTGGVATSRRRNRTFARIIIG